MAAGDQYFLAAADLADDGKFLAPKRTGSTVRPLIDGYATFQAIEVAIAKATTSVHFAPWSCNASLRLQAKDDVNKALAAAAPKSKPSAATWKDLLAAVAARGVDVRILMTDFDPVLKNDLHRICWEAYREFRAAAKAAKATTLQAMCSRHDAHYPTPQQVQDLFVTKRITGLVAGLNASDAKSGRARLNAMPGLWPWVKYNAATNLFILDTTTNPLQTYPASHHQKICIVDGKVGFCGGLDPHKGRLDTPEHKGEWHDLHLQVDDQLTADLERNFIARWNTEMVAFNTFIASAGTASLPPGKWLDAQPATAIATPAPTAAAGTGPATGQLLRTLASPTADTVPPNVRHDIRDVFQQAIAAATKFIYIENQYVRDTRLVTWLSATPVTVPVILVLPIAPEEVSDVGDLISQKGISLENSVVDQLRTALGARFIAVSLAQPVGAPLNEVTNQKDKPGDVGRLQIYVHSKTMIVDDEFAMVGSANTNKRSHEVDTEANIGWYDPAGVKKLRLALWRELLANPAGLETWTPADYVANWSAIATRNADPHRVGLPKGFVVPHDTTRFPGLDGLPMGQRLLGHLIPDEYTELTNENPEDTVLV
jgi:phosphatidylserine/phosphatidylglycerophosphate/cardiolipin synthase-like enzyme